LEEERMIGTSEAESFADTAGTPYCETSAKTGYGIARLFQTVVQRIAEEKPGMIEAPPPQNEIVEINSAVKKVDSEHCRCI
jgi:hypothetical protein